MNLIQRVFSLFVVTLMLTGLSFGQTAVVTGSVTDAESGEALPGANVKISQPGSVSIVAGGVSNIDGVYTITNVPAGTYEITASFVGYAETVSSVTLSAGQTFTQNFALSQGLELDAVVVTGIGEPEKVLDAPASISVIDAEGTCEEGANFLPCPPVGSSSSSGTSSSSSSSAGETDAGSADDSGSSGCNVGGGLPPLAVLVLLGAYRRRRR